MSQVPWGTPGAGGAEVHPMVGGRVQGGPFAPQRGDQSQSKVGWGLLGGGRAAMARFGKREENERRD